MSIALAHIMAPNPDLGTETHIVPFRTPTRRPSLEWWTPGRGSGRHELTATSILAT